MDTEPRASRFGGCLTWLCASIIGVIVIVALLRWSLPTDPGPLSVLQPFVERSKPLIEAIGRFEQDHGMPPATLDDLVPGYLEKVPDTGLKECPKYKYTRFDAKRAKSTLLWYDLGSRNGKEVTGLWVYSEGDPKHAILAIPLDGEDTADGARVDRMPENVTKIPFDSDKWRIDLSSRIPMVRSLGGQINGKRRDEIVALLGPPDGNVVTKETPWELRVTYNWNWGDPGNFIYWPTGKYPLKHWGHSTKVDDWVFLHF